MLTPSGQLHSCSYADTELGKLRCKGRSVPVILEESILRGTALDRSLNVTV